MRQLVGTPRAIQLPHLREQHQHQQHGCDTGGGWVGVVDGGGGGGGAAPAAPPRDSLAMTPHACTTALLGASLAAMRLLTSELSGQAKARQPPRARGGHPRVVVLGRAGPSTKCTALASPARCCAHAPAAARPPPLRWPMRNAVCVRHACYTPWAFEPRVPHKCAEHANESHGSEG